MKVAWYLFDARKGVVVSVAAHSKLRFAGSGRYKRGTVVLPLLDGVSPRTLPVVVAIDELDAFRLATKWLQEQDK